MNEKTKATSGSSWSFSKAEISRINSLFSHHPFPPFFLSLMNLLPCHISQHDFRGIMKGENIFLDENQKGSTTKARIGKSSCYKVKSPFKNLIINCPLQSCSPSLCE